MPANNYILESDSDLLTINENRYEGISPVNVDNVNDTISIDDNSITSEKIKSGETLPVNITGNAATVTHSNSVNGTSYKITGVESTSTNAVQPKKLETAKFYKDSNNGSILILGNVDGTTGVPDRGIVRLAAGTGHFSNIRLSNDTDTDYDTVIATPNTNGSRVIPSHPVGGAGNSTTPVYADVNGLIQACSTDSMTVGNANNLRGYNTLQSGAGGSSIKYQEIGTSPFRGQSGSSTTIMLQGQGDIGLLPSTWVFTFHCRNYTGPVMEVYSFGPTLSRIEFGYWKDSSNIYHFIAKYPSWCKEPVTMQCINKDAGFSFNVEDATTTEPTGVVYATTYNTVSTPYGEDCGSNLSPVYVRANGKTTKASGYVDLWWGSYDSSKQYGKVATATANNVVSADNAYGEVIIPISFRSSNLQDLTALLCVRNSEWNYNGIRSASIKYLSVVDTFASIPEIYVQYISKREFAIWVQRSQGNTGMTIHNAIAGAYEVIPETDVTYSATQPSDSKVATKHQMLCSTIGDNIGNKTVPIYVDTLGVVRALPAPKAYFNGETGYRRLVKIVPSMTNVRDTIIKFSAIQTWAAGIPKCYDGVIDIRYGTPWTWRYSRETKFSSNSGNIVLWYNNTTHEAYLVAKCVSSYSAFNLRVEECLDLNGDDRTDDLTEFYNDAALETSIPSGFSELTGV